MSLYLSEISDNYQIGVWKIEESESEMLAMLPQSCYEQVESFKSESRRKERLAVRVLLQEMMHQYHEISYNSSGKPYLKDDSANISISHTKDIVAVIISRAHLVGVDVETLGDRVCKIRSHFLSQEEESFINNKQEANHLLACWCAKEVLFKIIGVDEVDLKAHLHLQPFSVDAHKGNISALESRTEQALTYRLKYRFFPSFIMVWCIK